MSTSACSLSLLQTASRRHEIVAAGDLRMHSERTSERPRVTAFCTATALTGGLQWYSIARRARLFGAAGDFQLTRSGDWMRWNRTVSASTRRAE